MRRKRGANSCVKRGKRDMVAALGVIEKAREVAGFVMRARLFVRLRGVVRREFRSGCIEELLAFESVFWFSDGEDWSRGRVVIYSKGGFLEIS
jgi:hypothetical protein